MKKFRKSSKVIFKKQEVTLMKKKRILSWILCAAMLLSLMPAGVFASGTDVVKIEKSDGTFSSAAYESLGDAVSAADDGDTLWLVGNDEARQQVTIDKSLTVELQGYSLTDTAIKVTGSGVTVSINDRVGGAKINENHYTGFKWEGDISTLSRCSATVFVTGGATLNINGVTGTDKNTGTIIYDSAGADLVKAIFVDESTLVIGGGTFVAEEKPGRDSLFIYNGNVTINDGYFYRAISCFTAPSNTYPFIVRKCEINGGDSSSGAMWIQKSGTINGKSFSSGFQDLDDIGEIFLSQSSGSYVTSDSTSAHIKIGCTIYVPDNIESAVLPDGTIYSVGSGDKNAPEEISAKTGDKITLAPAVSGGSGEDITYAWKKDGTVLDSETGPTLDINSYTKDDGGLYEVTASQGEKSVTVWFRVGEAADENDTATETWLAAGNELYLGSIAVTAENAKNIIGSYSGTDITGTASFKVESGVPTLYLDNVTVKDGYKYGTFGTNAGTTDYFYRIYGIYYKPASDDKLAIKLSGTNVLEPEGYTDTKYVSFLTYGIMLENNCTEFSLNGDDDSKLNVTAESYTLKGITTFGKNCNILINGGEYVFKTTDIGIYNTGSLKIENAKLNITSEKNYGIRNDIGSEEGVTSIKNSDVTVKAGKGEGLYDGIFSSGIDMTIESSNVDIVCDGVGLYVNRGKSLTISGEDTVIKVKSVGPVRTNWDREYTAIRTECELGSETMEVGNIILEDGLAVTTPEAGRILLCDNDLVPDYDNWFGWYRTIFDTDGNYAREVEIKTPVTHAECGEADCREHTGSIAHTGDNCLNLVKNITTDGATLKGGSYYLSDDLAVGDGRELYIANNSTVNICLNGHELKAYIVPGENAVLNICDCKGGGRITNPDAHVIAFRKNNGTVNIYGGTLETSAANTIIDFGSDGALKGNVLNLYGGTVNYGGETVNTAIGSRTLTVNLYGGEINTTASNGIVVQNGKLNLCGNTVINVPANYDSIKVYGKEIIDAKDYTGGNVSILCSGLSDGDTVVKNVTDKTEGKFSLSAGDSDHILVREGSDLVLKALYTVAFLPNGGSGTMDPDRVPGGEYSLPDNRFTAPEGKKFKAWSVNGKEYNPEDVITVTSDTTVTAVWENKVKTPVQISEGPQRYEYDSGAKSFKITAANVSGGFSVSYEKDGIENVLPTGAGSYDVIIKRAADDVYAEYDKRIPGGLVIDPMDITGIAIIGAFGDMTYTGNAQTPVATVTAKNLHVTGSWSAVTNVSDKTTFTATGNFTGTVSDMETGMEEADSGISIAPLSVKNLNYNKNAQVLITAGEAEGGTLKYSIDNKATWSEELPKGTDAGEYYVWFMVFGDENHKDSYTNGLSVSIAKASVAIPTVPGKIYTGENLTADIADGEHYTVSENNGGTETGRYDVKLKLRDDANYYWEGKEKDVSVITVDFNISAAENKWTAEPSITGWTYGESANAPSYGAKFGDVKIEYKKASEPDSAYITAVPANAGDYNVRLSVAATKNFGALTKALDFTIAKASVAIPTVPGKVYTGENLTADITDGEHYTVSENNGGTEVGRYDVKFKLRDDANYYWEGKEKDVSEITVDFNISAAENKWTVEPSITDWTYGENANAPSYGAKFGAVTVEYKKAGEADSEYTAAVPSNAGEYNARLSVAATKNFGGLTEVLGFTIAKASVVIPTVSGKVYTGGLLTAEITDGEHYTVSENNGGTETGSYDVKLTLKDSENYYWEGKAEDVTEITAAFNIFAADNEWTTEPAITGWTYGENANAPSYGAKFGAVTVEYKKAGEADSEYTAAVPSNAGEYNARLSVAATKNFGGLTEVLGFTIAKASVVIPTVSGKVYTGGLLTAEITDGEHYTVSENNGGTETGSYDVKLTLKDSENYYWEGKAEDVTEITAAFNIFAADNEWTTEPAITGWTYGENANAPSYGAKFGNVTAEYKKSDEADSAYNASVPTKAGEYNVRLSVAATKNFGGLTEVLDFTIAKDSQSAPEFASGVNETIRGRRDGKITGTDSTMEYKADGSAEYTAVSGNEILNLVPGTYLVRYKENDNYLAGEDKVIVIAAGEMITVTFDTNGGSAVDSETCEYNQTVGAPAEPTKEGYAFNGWFADSALTDEWDFAKDMLTESRTLYAKWVQGTVSGGEGNVKNVTAEGLNDVAKAERTDISLIVQVQQSSNDDDEQKAIRGIKDAPRHFEFYDIELKKFSGGKITEAPSAIEIRLPYSFSRKKGIRVYRYHNGTAEELTRLAERNTTGTYEDGKCFIDTENGYIYIYSSKFSTYSVAYNKMSSSGVGNSTSGGSGATASTDYTVSFETNGAGGVSKQTVKKNGTVKEPAAPTKEGFDFAGWYSDKELKTKYDFSEKVTKSFTLYAAWTKDSSENQIILTIGEKAALVFGETKYNDVAPVIKNDRTMLPARFVAENLGAKVEWDEEKRLVTITGKDVTILITIGSDTATVNGRKVKLDSPAFIENNRTYTPIRFISEELGATVEWIESEQKVVITKAE